MTEQEARQLQMFTKYLSDPEFVSFLLGYWVLHRMGHEKRMGLSGELSELEAHELILSIRGTPTEKMKREWAEVQRMFKELTT